MNRHIKYLVESFLDDEDEIIDTDINISARINQIFALHINHILNTFPLKEINTDIKKEEKLYYIWLKENRETFNEIKKLRQQGAKYVVKTKAELLNIINHYTSRTFWKNWNWIDTSLITDMSNLFQNSVYILDISGWDVSNVTDMSHMFEGVAKPVNISNWDVSNVTNMSHMFENSSENWDISNWDVSNVTDMSNMFEGCNIKCDITGWNVSNVRNMESMFAFAYGFNLDISGWDVSNVTNMAQMFLEARSFNLSIDEWDVSNVTNMYKMFEYCRNLEKLPDWYHE